MFLPNYLQVRFALGRNHAGSSPIWWSFPLLYSSAALSPVWSRWRSLPRLLNLFLTPGKVYPLYGFHYATQRTISRLTNLHFFKNLTGDSSLILYYLSFIGYHQPNPVQTGSNFGPAVKHDTPYLVTVGSGTMVSDGLSIITSEVSNTSFRIVPTTIGGKNFFGNAVVYPSAGKTGENCLFGTMTMVPIDGPIREGVGLLGSPPFEIPRSVQRDSAFDEMKTAEELKTRLPAKNRHNGLTLAMFLLLAMVRALPLPVDRFDSPDTILKMSVHRWSWPA